MSHLERLTCLRRMGISILDDEVLDSVETSGTNQQMTPHQTECVREQHVTEG